jgi:hypothetical protein
MFIYKPKDSKQLRNDFNRRRRENKNGFLGFEEFKLWYHLQKKICVYCEITEQSCQEIVVRGLLKSNRFPIKGKLQRGKARGMWLEVDRKDPSKKYSKSNCVLAFYFCNNDKSDVFTFDQYLEFRENRNKFLNRLL